MVWAGDNPELRSRYGTDAGLAVVLFGSGLLGLAL